MTSFIVDTTQELLSLDLAYNSLAFMGDDLFVTRKLS
jgi:hypothetical protein